MPSAVVQKGVQARATSFGVTFDFFGFRATVSRASESGFMRLDGLGFVAEFGFQVLILSAEGVGGFLGAGDVAGLLVRVADAANGGACLVDRGRRDALRRRRAPPSTVVPKRMTLVIPEFRAWAASRSTVCSARRSLSSKVASLGEYLARRRSSSASCALCAACCRRMRKSRSDSSGLDQAFRPGLRRRESVSLR